jgi:hypothetical protein
VTDGYDVEDNVGVICNKLFLKDYVVRNPKFKKESGNTKEAADIVIPYEGITFVFQIKSKIDKIPNSKKTEKDINRILSKINEGIKQFKMFKRAIASNYLSTMITERGVEIPLNFYKDNNVIGIIVIELIGEEQFSSEERFQIYNGYTEEFDIPIHIFKRNIFEEFVRELDTIQDMKKYLEIREKLFKSKVKINYVNELDFLAIYKQSPSKIDELIEGDYDILHICNGYWDNFQSSELLKKRDQENKYSYIFDGIISTINKGIDFKLNVDISEQIENTDKIERYWQTINALSSFTRLERRGIGKKIVNVLERAEDNGQAYTVAFLNNKPTFLILSSKKNRNDRSTLLYDLSAAFICGYPTTYMVSVATETASANLRSYDVIVFKDVEFEEKDKYIEYYKKNFGTLYHSRETEF